ncbi:hypothetical protein SDC9_131501 [bioreactor metagenome]|uniref:Uncharacterized protein n=1 Tax=bioreactor metagenome TaxID=1076179 RepID=A0A645D5D5_9ZZZZ
MRQTHSGLHEKRLLGVVVTRVRVEAVLELELGRQSPTQILHATETQARCRSLLHLPGIVGAIGTNVVRRTTIALGNAQIDHSIDLDFAVRGGGHGHGSKKCEHEFIFRHRNLLLVLFIFHWFHYTEQQWFSLDSTTRHEKNQPCKQIPHVKPEEATPRKPHKAGNYPNKMILFYFYSLL